MPPGDNPIAVNNNNNNNYYYYYYYYYYNTSLRDTSSIASDILQ